MVSGLAVNASGTRLLATNYENDSISLVDLQDRKKIAELDLRPGRINSKQRGVPGGEFPYWAVFKGEERSYVSIMRDRQIVMLTLRPPPSHPTIIKLVVHLHNLIRT